MARVARKSAIMSYFEPNHSKKSNMDRNDFLKTPWSMANISLNHVIELWLLLLFLYLDRLMIYWYTTSHPWLDISVAALVLEFISYIGIYS